MIRTLVQQSSTEVVWRETDWRSLAPLLLHHNRHHRLKDEGSHIRFSVALRSCQHVPLWLHAPALWSCRWTPPARWRICQQPSWWERELRDCDIKSFMYSFFSLTTVDHEIFAVKNFSSMTFSDENWTREIFCVTYVDLYLFWSLKSGDEI